MQSKHTPEPWKVFPPTRQNPSRASVSTEDGACDIYDAPLTNETEANARLIAAAPELLAACVRAESFMSGFEGDSEQLGIDGDLQVIRTAITKAQET
jgi:hypothetical protein